MIARDLTVILREYAHFPVIAILGPRQSGKTTLAKEVFKSYTYLSLEDPKTRDLAQEDPKAFLELYENSFGIILDEFQLVPQLLSVIQGEVDTKKRPGYFVLTGSHNFLMNQAIGQSLAGRVGILTLLPLSLHELQAANLLKNRVEEVIFNGFYPRIYAENSPALHLYPSYIQTYLERDVRQLSQLGDLNTFRKFIKLCAGRVGQLLNLSDLANACGMSLPTMQRWLSILEASYIVFLLQPYAHNFNKRVIKHPKIYFYDTGLLCSLLDIESPERLVLDHLRGSIFENFIIADLYKEYVNLGRRPLLYFWRDKNGAIEIDCIIEYGRTLYPIEIKSSSSISLDYFTNLKKWNALAQAASLPVGKSYIIYGGEKTDAWNEWEIVGWKDIDKLLEKIRFQ